MIDYNNYQEYEDLDALNIKFLGKPVKDLETDIYKVPLKTPIIFQIPKSKIEEINENQYEQHIGSYLLNDENFGVFLNNLDAYVVNLSNNYSLKWFGKNLNQKVLLKFYENLFTIENNKRLLNFYITDEDILEEITNYNIDEDQEILLEINSIEIYKRTFKLCMKVHSIEYPDDALDEDDEMINFEKMIQSQKSVCETNIIDDSSFSTKVVNRIVNSDEYTSLPNEIDTNDNINDEDIHEGSLTDEEQLDTITQDEESNNLINNTDVTSPEDGENKHKTILEEETEMLKNDESLREEVLNLIKEKETLQQNILDNTERVENASHTLKSRASEIDDELRSYREKLKSLN